MKEVIKENAQADFIEIIKKSWTFGKMSKYEQKNCILALEALTTTSNALRGNYGQRWETMQAIYSGFLCALGYYDNCAVWRSEN